MSRLDILKKLEARRKRGTQIQKSMVSKIQYAGDMRRAMDRETMRAEHTRIRGILAKGGTAIPSVMRDRYDELSKHLGQTPSS